MIEDINIELAIHQFQGLCRSAGIELSDVLYVAERLVKAEDLGNVYPEARWPIGLDIYADYVGTKSLWKEYAIGSDEQKRQEQEIADYFWDLGQRTQLQFQNLQSQGGFIPNPRSNGYRRFSVETTTPSGKNMRILFTQHYTYEQNFAHRASRGR